MTARPILFSGQMVRAILDGSKTQTRRVLKPQTIPYQPGDLLWVREAWRAQCDFDGVRPADIPPGSWVQYDADQPISPWLSKHRPSIHMPRWASRITLRVTAVKVERVQDISEADAWAEGVSVPSPAHAVRGFRDLWNFIHGPDAWDANPWVAAYTFERVMEDL